MEYSIPLIEEAFFIKQCRQCASFCVTNLATYKYELQANKTGWLDDAQIFSKQILLPFTIVVTRKNINLRQYQLISEKNMQVPFLKQRKVIHKHVRGIH